MRLATEAIGLLNEEMGKVRGRLHDIALLDQGLQMAMDPALCGAQRLGRARETAQRVYAAQGAQSIEVKRHGIDGGCHDSGISKNSINVIQGIGLRDIVARLTL